MFFTSFDQKTAFFDNFVALQFFTFWLLIFEFRCRKFAL